MYILPFDIYALLGLFHRIIFGITEGWRKKRTQYYLKGVGLSFPILTRPMLYRSIIGIRVRVGVGVEVVVLGLGLWLGLLLGLGFWLGIGLFGRVVIT